MRRVALVVVALLALGTLPLGPAGAATATLTELGSWNTPWFRAFYQRDITGELFSSAAVGDVDGDGQPEVVAGFPDGIVTVWHTNGVLFLRYDTGPGAVQASPTLVDLNKDGVLDILAANTAGYVRGFTAAGQTLFAVKDTCRLVCGVFGTPTVADLDRDGGLDVIASSWDGYLHAWRLNGTELPGFPQFTHDTIWSSPAVADLDGDGSLEIVVGGDCDGVPGQPCYPLRGGWVIVYRADGTLQPGWPRFVPDQVVWSSPAIADISGDGLLDVIVGTGTMTMPGGQLVNAFDRNGNPLPGWPAAVGGKVMASPAIGDLDGNGGNDVVVVADNGYIYALNGSGQLLPGWPRCAGSSACPVPLHGSAVIADVDNDGAQEVVFGGEQWMRVFSGNGTLESARPTRSGMAPMTAAPTVASVNGTTWVVQAGGFDQTGDGVPDYGTIWVWGTGTALGPSAWPTFKQNPRRTGTFLDSVAPTSSVTPLAATQTSTRVPVVWTGNDGGSGVATFDTDVRDGLGPWVPWLRGSSIGSRSGADAAGGYALFGLPGHSYSVRVRAVDRAGNVGAWSPSVTTAISATAARAQPFTLAYAVNGHGDLSAISSPPAAVGAMLGNDLMRGIAVRPSGGGYALDGWGGLHPFGGAPPVQGTGYWPGWDIARGVALNADGSGYVLDGWGGLHPFGGAARVSSGGYWPGWDIARGVVLLPASSASNPGGYVLDGWGGLHRFGSAPPIQGATGYWPGRDIARGIVLNPDGTSGYVLEGWGGLHRFGGAAFVGNGPYWHGWDIAAGAVSYGTAASPAGYVLDGFGGVHRFGSAPPVEVTRYWGRDIARGIALRP